MWQRFPDDRGLLINPITGIYMGGSWRGGVLFTCGPSGAGMLSHCIAWNEL
jgi:hypothetical protein